ncbi:MAG: vitamin K epoxide reductase family protein [Actinomycetota bacterium]
MSSVGASPRWLWPACVVPTVAGFAISGYLTWAHFREGAVLACPETGVINCQKVTSSPQSYLFGVPVAVLGLLFFAAMLVLTFPPAWRSPNPLVHRARLLTVSAGVLFVIYLVYAEVFVLDAICLWCTAVHALTVVLFAVISVGTAVLPDQG